MPAAAAGTWKLGDMIVNRLGFGAMRLTGSAAFDLGAPSDRDQSIRVLRRAVELGVNHIDTAAFYFSPLRSANELINTALAPYPDDLVIATKVGPGRDPSGEWLDWARPDQLRGQVEENLRQLGRDHLDLVNLRAYPVRLDRRALRRAGRAARRGADPPPGRVQCPARPPGPGPGHRAGGVRAEPLRRRRAAGGPRVPPGLRASRASRSCRSSRSRATARERRPEAPTTTRYCAVAAAHGVTPAQVRLAWTLQQGPHVLAIPGTGNPDHLDANVAAAALRLSPGEIARLEAIS